MRLWARSPTLSLSLAAALATACGSTSLDGGTGGSAGSTTSTGSGGAGGASSSGAFGQQCAADADCAEHQCVSGTCTWTTVCPGPAPGPAASWASCAAGLDPTKAGGELLWTTTVALFPSCDASGCGAVTTFAIGPAGDVLVGALCSQFDTSAALIARLDGAGRSVTVLEQGYEGYSPLELGFSPHNDPVLLTQGLTVEGPYGLVHDFGPPEVEWASVGGAPELFPAGWFADPLGNLFADVKTVLAVTVAPGVHLPASPDVSTPVDYVLRGDASGTSFLAVPGGTSFADGAGGAYRTGPLPGALDLGCGPLQPAGAGSTYLVRFGPSWACALATALPVMPRAIADGAGGVYLAASSSTALDLGCGALPAAPGGSLFVTRLDGAGHCLWGRAFVAPAPALTLIAAPGGGLVLSGAAGSGPVDLGAGALPPVGAADEVLAELGPDGATLWSRRLGAPRGHLHAAGGLRLRRGRHLPAHRRERPGRPRRRPAPGGRHPGGQLHADRRAPLEPYLRGRRQVHRARRRLRRARPHQHRSRLRSRLRSRHPRLRPRLLPVLPVPLAEPQRRRRPLPALTGAGTAPPGSASRRGSSVSVLDATMIE
jgi:hypothetical protein